MVCQASYCAGAELFFFGWMPADGGGIEEHFGALKRGQARAFRVPLIPANQGADAAKARFKTGAKTRAKARIHGLKAQVARREVVLLEVERIVRDVHLAIDADDVAGGIERDRGVVIKTRSAALKERGNDRDARFARYFG